MKIQQYLAMLAIVTLPLLTGSAQISTPISPSVATEKLSPGAAEVEALVQSGVGDDVVLSYIGQSPSYFSLSAVDIVALKNAGVSSQAVTAMLNHDSALHNQDLAASAASSTTEPAAPAVTTSAVVAPPPAPLVETVPVSPGPDYIWTPGWWSWDGGSWIWFRGYWGHPVRPGHVWHDGRFYHGRGIGAIRERRR